MLRKTFIALLLLVTTAAVADGPGRQGVIGLGSVVNDGGKVGLFSIRAVKILYRNNPVVEGDFRFTTGNRDTNTTFTVEASIRRLNIQDKTATYRGEGVLVVRRGLDVRRFPGILEGTATDRRRPDDTTTTARDGLRFVFDPVATGVDNFAFAGPVKDGDILVAIRN